MTTLESLVNSFRRSVSEGSTEGVELEIRFQRVDYSVFESVYHGLIKEGGKATISTTVNVIMTGRSRGHQAHDAKRSQHRRQITFVDGVKQKGDLYISKSSLIHPLDVKNPYALDYKVTLSSEAAEPAFTADGGAIIRVIARVNFGVRLAASHDAGTTNVWTVSLSCVRQLSGDSAAASLPAVVEGMLKTPTKLSPANFLQVLRLGDPAVRSLCRFEIECEFVGCAGSKSAAPALGAARDVFRPADVSAAAEQVLKLVNPNFLRDAAFQAEVYFVAKHIVQEDGFLRRFEHELPLKRLLPQVLAITRGEYAEIYPPLGFWCTDKADGLRAIAVVRNGRVVVLAGNELYEFTDPSNANTTIADAELVYSDAILVTASLDPHKPEKWALHVFDVIAVDGETVARDGIEKRVNHLARVCEILVGAGVAAKPKEYAHITDVSPKALEKQFRRLREGKRPYRVDGIILNRPGQSYWEQVAYKWKDHADNTIDFLARLCPPRLLGTAPFVEKPGHRLHFLFVGVNQDMFDALGMQWCPGYGDLFGEESGDAKPNADEKTRGAAPRRLPAQSGNYFPVQFATSDAPLAYLYQHPVGAKVEGKEGPNEIGKLKDVDAMVVEARCPGDCAAAGGGAPTVDWEVVKIRQDRARDLLSKRYYGNDLKTAELIWNNYIDPFEFEQLWTGPQLGYFAGTKDEKFKAQTAAISFVKSQVFNTLLRNENVVLDLAFGRGADLFRYIDVGVKTLFGVDIDRAALAEAVRRKFSGKKGQHGGPRRGTTLHVLVADLLRPYGDTLTALRGVGFPQGGGDAIVMNLAVHYMLGTTESMKNFVVLCRDGVKVGGHVIILCMLGHRIHKLFTDEKVPEGKSWDVRAGTVLKYSLKRMYAGATLQAAGQKIGVLLPFSDGKYYEEFLVNVDALVKMFEDRGFSHASTILVEKRLDDFRAHNPEMFRALSDDDKRYLSLFGVLVLKKTK
ncbi:MAG: hypothetical protein KGL39_10510 [Patescibacteria group bacterium]|nr:hypothetical protein [Patescibacteria group bacterium]